MKKRVERERGGGKFVRCLTRDERIIKIDGRARDYCRVIATDARHHTILHTIWNSIMFLN